MAELKEFTVSLTTRYNQPKPGRANKSINYLRLRISRAFHLPPESIKLSNAINEFVWAHGRTKPPRKVPMVLKHTGKEVEAFLLTEMDAVKKAMQDEKEKGKKKAEKVSKEKAAPVPSAETEAELAEKQKQKQAIEQAAVSMEHKH